MNKAKKTNLTILHLQQLRKNPTPGAGCDERQQALEDQNQRKGSPKRFGHRAGPYFAALLLRMALKKSELGSTTKTSDLLAKLAL